MTEQQQLQLNELTSKYHELRKFMDEHPLKVFEVVCKKKEELSREEFDQWYLITYKQLHKDLIQNLNEIIKVQNAIFSLNGLV